MNEGKIGDRIKTSIVLCLPMNVLVKTSKADLLLSNVIVLSGKSTIVFRAFFKTTMLCATFIAIAA